MSVRIWHACFRQLFFGCVVWLVECCCINASAQELGQTPPLTFSGTSVLSTQWATRQGTDQGIPDKYARWEFDPTVGLFGIPLSVHMFLATETNESGNTINTFGLTFSMTPQKLRDFLLQRVRDRVAPADAQQNLDEVHEIDQLRSEANDPSCDIGAKQLADLEARHASDSTANSDTLKLIQDLRAAKQHCEEIRARLADAEKVKAAVDEGERVKKEVQDRGIESIANPNELRSALGEIGLLNSAEKFMLDFVTFGIGQTYPNYTPLTLSGIPVNGFNIEFNPGQFYVAGASGSVQPPALASALGIMEFGRTLQAVRLGAGERFGSHFIFTLIHAKDDGSSVNPDSTVLRDSLGLFPTPQENLVFGIDARGSLLDDKLTVEGEADGSVLTSDTRNADIANSDIPSIVDGLITPKVSSFFDYAYQAQAGYNDFTAGTKISALMKRVGPGYYSLGAPNIRNDIFHVDGKIDQSFFSRQFSISLGAREEHDNLINTKSFTTSLTGITAGFGVTLRRMPSFRVNYTLTAQSNDATVDSLILNNHISSLVMSSGYSYAISTMTLSTTVSYLIQNGTTYHATSDFGINTISLNQFLAFRFPLSLGGTISYTSRQAPGDTGIVSAIDLSATFMLFATWQNTIGGGYMNESDRGVKTGMYYATQFPIIRNNVAMIFRLERNIYTATAAATQAIPIDPGNPSSTLVGDYNEWVVRATLSTRW